MNSVLIQTLKYIMEWGGGGEVMCGITKDRQNDSFLNDRERLPRDVH